MSGDQVFSLILSGESVFVLKNVAPGASVIAARYDMKQANKVTVAEMRAFLLDSRNYTEKR